MAGRTGPCTDRRRDRRTGSSCWSGCFWQLRIRGASCTSVCNRMPRRRDSISVTPPSPLLAAQRGLGVDREQDVCIPDRTTTKTRPATGRRFSCVPPSGSQRITSPLAPLFSFSLGGHHRGRIRVGAGSAQTDSSLSGHRGTLTPNWQSKMLEPSRDGRLGAVLRTL